MNNQYDFGEVPLQNVAGGVYGQSGSVFVLDGVTLLNTEEQGQDDDNTERLPRLDNWDAIPKDVKMYMMDFMPLKDYARMSQVSKSWNKAAKKHRFAIESANRETAFDQEKRERGARERAERARRRRQAIESACSPLASCFAWFGDNWGKICCAFIVVALFVGYSVMVGLFLWSPIFITGPQSLQPTEFQTPQANFMEANCTVSGAQLNQGLCRGSSTSALRYVYNVSVLGRAQVSGIVNPGDAYFDCDYNPSLRSLSPSPAFAAPFGQVVPCLVDPLFITPFSAVTLSNSRLLTKDFAYLYFSRTNTSTWGSGSGYRAAGAYLGYIWIAMMATVLYLVVLLSCKVCCR